MMNNLTLEYIFLAFLGMFIHILIHILNRKNKSIPLTFSYYVSDIDNWIREQHAKATLPGGKHDLPAYDTDVVEINKARRLLQRYITNLKKHLFWSLGSGLFCKLENHRHKFLRHYLYAES